MSNLIRGFSYLVLWPYYLLRWALSGVPTSVLHRLAQFVGVAFQLVSLKLMFDMKNYHWDILLKEAPYALAIVVAGSTLYFYAYAKNKLWPLFLFFWVEGYGMDYVQHIDLRTISPSQSYGPDTGILILLFLATFVILALVRHRAENERPAMATMAARHDQTSSLANRACRSEITFSDIFGMDDAKKRLKRAGTEIVGPQIKAGFVVNQVLALTNKFKTRKPASLRNGIMLFGGPGNGKSAFANALAGELGLPIMTMTYGDVASRWVNQTTETVVQYFRDARANAPCVFFIDEIDSLIPARDGGSGSGYEEAQKTTNAILTEIVNLRGSGVVLVAATNFLDRLDKAAIREGRFDYKIEVPPPDQEARVGILTQAIQKHVGSTGFQPAAIERAATRWDGFSVKRIQAVAEELAEMSQEMPLKGTFDDLMAAMRRLQGHKGDAVGEAKPLSELVLESRQREQLQAIALRLKNIEAVENMGGTVPSGILFLGPPGTGKTETARSLAKESGFAFLAETGNSLLSNARRLDKVLDQAKNIRPCIVFIDEADDVLADRSMSFSSNPVTNSMLAAMDGVQGKLRDVVFIAATNHPDRIDPAALRGGRFTEKVTFSLPDSDGVSQFVSTWLKKSKAQFEPELSPAAIASLLNGESIANVGAILQEAVNRMVGRSLSGGNDVVTRSDILSAKSSISY